MPIRYPQPIHVIQPTLYILSSRLSLVPAHHPHIHRPTPATASKVSPQPLQLSNPALKTPHLALSPHSSLLSPQPPKPVHIPQTLSTAPTALPTNPSTQPKALSTYSQPLKLPTTRNTSSTPFALTGSSPQRLQLSLAWSSSARHRHWWQRGSGTSVARRWLRTLRNFLVRPCGGKGGFK